MRLLDLFRLSKRENTALVAKERLKIIVSHERTRQGGPDYLPALERELLDVIRKYVPITEEQIRVQLDRSDNFSVLELNITLPEAP